MWWWDFDKEEPLQEDLVVYEKFMEYRRDRARMNKQKAEQKAAAEAARSSSGKSSVSHASYNIPDPTN